MTTTSFIAAIKTDDGWDAKSFSTDVECWNWLLDRLIKISEDVSFETYRDCLTEAATDLPDSLIEALNYEDGIHDWFWVMEI